MRASAARSAATEAPGEEAPPSWQPLEVEERSSSAAFELLAGFEAEPPTPEPDVPVVPAELVPPPMPGAQAVPKECKAHQAAFRPGFGDWVHEPSGLSLSAACDAPATSQVSARLSALVRRSVMTSVTQ